MSGLAFEPGWAVAFAALAGLAIGSFLNVVIHRLPRMLENQWQDDATFARGETPAPRERYDLIRPRSHCPSCGSTLRLRDLVPVASWLALGGRCSSCANLIGGRYPIIELTTAALFALCVLRFGAGSQAAGAMILVAALLAAAAIDFDTQLLPDAITLPLAWGGLIANLSGLFAALPDAVLGAVAGYLSLWSIHHVFRGLTGREGMGYGDFKLLAAIGAWLGWQALPAIVLIACAGGIGFVVIAGFIRQRDASQPIAFGPWLAIAGLVALFAQPVLDRWIHGA